MVPPRLTLLALWLSVWLGLTPAAQAGGPRWVAGTAYFKSSVKGQPVVWSGGAIVYYTDQGALSSYVSNTAAANLVAAAAAPWTQVATAAVTITPGGILSEDVSGADVSGSRGAVVWPADVESTAKPVAVVYDADGSVLNTVFGAGASDSAACLTNAVTSMTDGFSTAGNITHAIVILNGLCATSASQVTNMQYLLTREFGRVLGLDWSQANDNVWTGSPYPSESDYQGWPLMHPVNINCGSDSYSCIPTAMALRMDDRAALGRLYPSSSFKKTLRIHGTISFPSGQGMQGVVVKATRLVTGTTTPDTSMVASCVSGFAFHGNAGNVVSGTTDAAGNPLARFGSDVATLEGQYDLAGLELVAGKTSSDYEITFEAVNPLYTGNYAVGPMLLGSPAPSGTLATVIVRSMSAGANVEEDVTVTDAAAGGTALSGTFAAPVAAPSSGAWQGWMSGYGHADFLSLSARPNRVFSVIATAMNESGAPSQSKAMPLLGAWFADDAVGALPDFAMTQAFDSSSEGTSILQVQTPAGNGAVSCPLVVAVADARGDGRPDYAYSGRVLYADSLSPGAVPTTGGVVAIAGSGFVAGERVLINGVSSPVLAVEPSLLVVQVAAGSGGSFDVEVDDPTGARAVLPGALSYGSASGGLTLSLVNAPGGSGPASGAVGAQAPGAFAVQVVDGNGNPAGGEAVSFTSQNAAQLSICGGASSCSVASSATGLVSTTLTPTTAGTDTVTASLADGAMVQVQWTATAVNGTVLQFTQAPLHAEVGQAVTWPVSVAVVTNGLAAAGAGVTWTVLRNGTSIATGTSQTNAQGIAMYSAAVPALALNGTATVQACAAAACATVVATGVQPGFPVAIPVAGTVQSVINSALFAPLQLQITDGNLSLAGGTGNPLAGASVAFVQSLYSYEASAGGKEPPARLLATSTTTVVSDWNGMASVQPLQQSGAAGTVVVTASSAGHPVGVFTLLLTPGSAPVAGGPVAPRGRIPLR